MNLTRKIPLILLVLFSAIALSLGLARTFVARADEKQPDHIVNIPAPNDSSEPASHKEVKSIGETKATRFENLTTFCMNREGNLLACDAKTNEIKTISPDGKVLATWDVPFAPYAIVVCPDGEIYIGGVGVIARLDSKGRVLKTRYSESDQFKGARASGIEVMGDDIFVCYGSGRSVRSLSDVVRFNRDLEEPVVIMEEARGCCQRLDIVAKDGFVYIAENARHRVVKCDRDGNIITRWGQKDPKDIEGFGSCCNPMNLCFGSDGTLYTAESGLARIKRYTPDGKYLGLVGHVGTERFIKAGRQAASCSNIAVAVSKDKSRVYVMDYSNNLIRVLAKAEN
ncbi:MAG: hypothetical protein KAR47_14840 [Planctomycetes bacterium]|nr:hypothetical protein [Planctomycetota bacterium]